MSILVNKASSFVETVEKINVIVNNGNLDEIVTVKDASCVVGGDSDVNPRNCVPESCVALEQNIGLNFLTEDSNPLQRQKRTSSALSPGDKILRKKPRFTDAPPQLKIVHWNCFKLTQQRLYEFENFLNILYLT